MSPERVYLYVDGDTALAGAYEQALGKSLTDFYASKPAVVALVKTYFPEEVIFEMNWSGTWHNAIQSLINWCKANKKVHKLVQCPLDDGMKTVFGPTLNFLLGAGVIVPASEAPKGKFKDVLAKQLPSETREMIAGQLISAVGKKSVLMDFVETALPDLSGKVDWTDISKAARSLVNLAIDSGRLGLLIEQLQEKHHTNEVEYTKAYLFGHGVIAHR